MASTVLKEILAIPEGELAATPVEELEQFATALHRAKPSIAPVFNIANNILLEIEHGSWSTTAIRAMLEKMLTGEKQSGPLIAQFAVEEMKGDWLMTFSYSGTVREVLIALSKRRNTRVTVAESLPGGEGRQFAKLLSESGIEAEVIHDSTIIARMELVDAAITGADSLTPHGLVNKVGTRIMVEAANVKDRPAYAVCGWSKLAPMVLSDPVIVTKQLGNRLSEHTQIFENTPLDLFSHIITDRGVFSPLDLRMELKMERVAQAWNAQDTLKRI
jgi:translation initiation factor eIF-2B subunit delta